MVTCVSFGCCRHRLLLIGLMESATVPFPVVRPRNLAKSRRRASHWPGLRYSWNVTRPGKVNDVTPEELREILGDGNVTVTLSLPQK